MHIQLAYYYLYSLLDSKHIYTQAYTCMYMDYYDSRVHNHDFLSRVYNCIIPHVYHLKNCKNVLFTFFLFFLLKMFIFYHIKPPHYVHEELYLKKT